MAWGRWRRAEAAAARLREGLRLSPNEERYVLAETLTGQVYAVPSGARFKGPLPFDVLIEALQATCDRHESRRTGYERNAEGVFTKYVEARATIHLEKLSMPGASDAQIIEAVNAHTMAKGDLSPGQLHRFILIELGPDDHVFAFALHHATADGVAFNAFVMEVYARLLGFPLPEDPGQYSDFWDFDWAASEAYRAAEAFWQERLGGIGDPGAWPADRPRGASKARLGERSILPPEVVARTRAAAAEIGVTPFTYFYAVYLVLLSRMIGSETVVTTFQSAGRKGFPGAERTSGVFSNSLIVGTHVDPTESIATIARRLRGEVKSALAHEIYPYHHVIRTTGVRARYAMNWLLPMGGVITFDDIQIIPILLWQNQDDDDLNLRFGEYDGQFHLTLYYDPSAYEADRVAEASRQVAALADELARDVNRPVGQVALADLDGPDVLPDPAQALPGGGTARIFDTFLERVREAPDAIALAHGDRNYSYAEVEARSRGLAQRLRAAGVATGDRVAILAERGPELVWSMLAVARAGGAFVVLDDAYPEPRLAQLAAACSPSVVLHTGGGGIPGRAARLADDVRAGLLDAAEARDDTADLAGLDAARSTDLAYILFTSGSTGRPKAVACSHQPLAHFVDWHARTHELGSDDRFVLLSGLSHDPMLRDVFTPLSIGARLCIPPATAISTPGALGRWLTEAAVSVAHLTPQMGQVAATQALPHLRSIFWGGDRLRRELVADIARLAPGLRQTAFYGTTETPQAAGACPVHAGMVREIALAGRGIEGVQLLVVGADRRPAAIGELGEIAVRSNWLSLGYVEGGQLLLASDRGRDPAGLANIYFTGDQGLYLPDGSVMFVGRRDDQVKVRGHRVALAEVVTALEARPGVREAVVLPVGEGDELALAAFVVLASSGGDREAELKSALTARLPSHMVPQRILSLDRLPRSPNGKIDRAALIARYEAATASPPEAPARPANAGERRLIAAWSAVLGDRRWTTASTFAGAGGDSLSYVRIYLATQEVIGDPPEGWPLMTIADLAASQKMEAAPRREMDSAIALRAGAIALVVAGHYGWLRYGGGATSALLLISGYLFGGMGLSEVFRTRSAAPAVTVLRNILIPTAIMGVVIWLFRLPGHPPPAYILLMTADLQDWRTAHPQDLHLWFVHGLIHILAFVALCAAGLQVFGRFGVGRTRFLLGLFALGCLGRFVLPGWLDPAFFQLGARHLDMIDYLPTTHLATFALGGLAACAETPVERRRLLALVVAYALLSAPFFGPGAGVFILAGGSLLMFRPRLAVPGPIAAVVFAVAGASLWIYLTHVMLRDGLHQLGLSLMPGLDLIAALALGVGIAKTWGAVSGALRRTFGRNTSPVVAEAVV